MAGCAGCGESLAPSRGSRSRRWCSERCRKASYGDPCVDCDAKTRFGAEAARVDEPRCHPCSVAHRTVWDRETILARFREWNALYGAPPAVPDWDLYRLRVVLHDTERVERWKAAEGHWPSFKRVFDVFGSWSNAMVAAGFEPRAAHGGGANQLRRRSMKAAA
jgi:hypothetical protein